jgi:aspartate racemase
MSLEHHNIIGIAGGMGPQAGLALFNRILRHTDASSDQEHLPIVLMSFPKDIPDRTAFLQGKVQENPAMAIATVVEKLVAAGANIGAIACNTSYVPEIFDVLSEELVRRNCKLNLLHMPRETCRYIKNFHPAARRIGVMSTNGAYEHRLYQNLLINMGYEVITPDEPFQSDVIHKMIYDKKIGIKANPAGISSRATSMMNLALKFFEKQNADVIVLGCTELSLLNMDVLHSATTVPLVDSVDSMALALIREATSKMVSATCQTVAEY